MHFMPNALQKRSIQLGARRTSVALEPAFWTALEEIAAAKHTTLTKLIQHVRQQTEGDAAFASALRVFALLNRISRSPAFAA